MVGVENKISVPLPEPVEVKVCDNEDEIIDMKPDPTNDFTLTVDYENYHLADTADMTSQSAEQGDDMLKDDGTENMISPNNSSVEKLSRRKRVRQSKSGLNFLSDKTFL